MSASVFHRLRTLLTIKALENWIGTQSSAVRQKEIDSERNTPLPIAFPVRNSFRFCMRNPFETAKVG